ncbi:hypothetical protein [Nonomuraea sp. LPB2021202275-12-8]|uniref:hypothetical protein n=1 Tax=Nonomuraea sp. LPB2021202275-12-8 TaxID=3120159 RepID=UPI00300CA4C6
MELGDRAETFSNYNSWVEWFAGGAMVVSTLPRDLNGSFGADIVVPAGAVEKSPERSSLDADNFHSGWGVWHGTSFATPVVAAEIARRLMETGTLTHDRPSPQEAVKRARTVVESMQSDFRDGGS